MLRLSITIYLLNFSLITFGQSQIEISKLKFPENPKFSVKFQKAINRQKSEFRRIFRKDSLIIKNYSVEFMLNKIDTDSDYEYVFEAEYWIAFHYSEIIPQLINRLTNKTEVGITNSADLIIWERNQTGQLKSYGHGGVSFDDVFTIAGRANRLLTKITGEDYGHVSMYSTKKQLSTLQKKWILWLNKL
jgi:hypothetical protein